MLIFIARKWNLIVQLFPLWSAKILYLFNTKYLKPLFLKTLKWENQQEATFETAKFKRTVKVDIKQTNTNQNREKNINWKNRCPLLAISSMFLFFDKFIFERKKVPTVITSNVLHGVYNFSFSPWIPFCGRKFSDTLTLTMREGVGFRWNWTKLILTSIFIR